MRRRRNDQLVFVKETFELICNLHPFDVTMMITSCNKVVQ